jgi:hypothetical protein
MARYCHRANERSHYGTPKPFRSHRERRPALAFVALKSGAAVSTVGLVPADSDEERVPIGVLLD